MAENKTVTTEATENERVEIFVPKGATHDDPNMFISINGVNYLLPKGKKSLVPHEVAREFYRAQKAQEIFDATIDELLEQTK